MSSPPYQPEGRTCQLFSGPVGPQILNRWGSDGRFWKQQAMHVQRAAVPIIRPIMVGTSLPCFGCINLARVATLMTPMITPKKYPWTLAQIADPRAEFYDHGFLLRQLAVVADGLSRRPCSFASPPFGGFAFSSIFSFSCLACCKVPLRSYYAAKAIETILPEHRLRSQPAKLLAYPHHICDFVIC